MPSDNPSPIAAGEDVEFPRNGVIRSTSIGRTGDSSFILTEPGDYLVQFLVSVTESGQLVLTLNDDELPYTVVGRSAGTSQLAGLAIVNVTQENSILTVRNPAGISSTLTITPSAGGTEPVSAHLVILRLR